MWDHLHISTSSLLNLQFGAESNQAIMLVTDGVPYTYENIFQVISKIDLPF